MFVMLAADGISEESKRPDLLLLKPPGQGSDHFVEALEPSAVGECLPYWSAGAPVPELRMAPVDEMPPFPRLGADGVLILGSSTLCVEQAREQRAQH